MPTFAKWILATVALVIAACLALMIAATCYHKFGAPGQEHRERETALAPLLQSHATVQQVTQALALTFIDYSRDSTNHAALKQWLSREPSTSFVRVREGAARHPGVLFHSTMWTMTWLFFDADGKLQDFYLGAQ